jgi:uncharacterized protein YdeI (YjbR/CyaY-like superfamily)
VPTPGDPPAPPRRAPGEVRSPAPTPRPSANSAPRPTVGADDERFQPADLAAWRAWLAANHATAAGVWVVTFKRTSGKPVVSYEGLVEEALCFGWIDSQLKKVDDERTMLRFTPRKRGGTWARTNRERVERLIADGRMTEAGLLAIETAKADGSWNALDDVDELRTPDDLAAALAGDPAAARGFGALSDSAKRPILFWVASAKRPETRARRIAEVLRYVAVGRSPLEWPRRPPEE